MLKELILTGITALCFSRVFDSFKNPYLSEFSGLTSLDWVTGHVEEGDDTDVSGDETDYKITNLKKFGRRVRTVKKYQIDGLTLDYDVHSLAAEAGKIGEERFNINGFYFSNDTNAYPHPDAHSHNEAIYSITSKLALENTPQDRFGIFSHHDIFVPGEGLMNVKCYYDLEKQNKGFGFSDGTMVMSHRSENINGLRFKFKKVNDDTFKVTITELYSGTMWQDKQYNHNYDGGKTFVYVDANSFNMDEDGKSYLFCYGYKTDVASEKCIPEIHIKNIKISEGCSVSFYSNGEIIHVQEKIPEGTIIEEPTSPTREGYTFTGWYKDSSLSELFDFKTTPIDDDITLYAGWSLKTFTVKFNCGGFLEVKDRVVTYNGTVKEPTISLGDSLTFSGWYKDSNFTEKFDFENTKITADTTIYGKFAKVAASKLNPAIIIVPSIVGAGLIGFGIYYFITYSKKKKIALVEINKVRNKYKEKNKNEK